MPVTFETPMFWTEQQRDQLLGTDIAGKSPFPQHYCDSNDIYIDRIGREDAEAEYTSLLAPFIKVSSFLKHQTDHAQTCSELPGPS